MFKAKKFLFLIAETPLHPGSGSEIGIVDLPIQRERYTDFPKIESSGLKGCIREAFEISNLEIEINGNKIRPKNEITFKTNYTEKTTNYLSLVFGPEEGEIHAGAIVFTDAKILLFPVKSLKGVFAWITSPIVLERFRKDMKLANIEMGELDSLNFSDLINTVPKQSNILVLGKVVLEEFTFEVKENDQTTNVAEFLSEKVFPKDSEYDFWREKLKKDLVILPDDDFAQFVKMSTEVITRIRIDSKTGTVQSGGLWTEEYLPQDSILYSIVMFTPLRIEIENGQKVVLKGETPEKEAQLIAEFFEKGLPKVIQIGGNQTIGKGFVRVNLI